jgi:hypothetical protein
MESSSESEVAARTRVVEQAVRAGAAVGESHDTVPDAGASLEASIDG